MKNKIQCFNISEIIFQTKTNDSKISSRNPFVLCVAFSLKTHKRIAAFETVITVEKKKLVINVFFALLEGSLMPSTREVHSLKDPSQPPPFSMTSKLLI